MTLEIDTQTVNTATIFPLKATAQINIPEVLRKAIVCPEIKFKAYISKISKIDSKTQVEAQVEGSISNPNPIDFNFAILQQKIQDKNGVILQYVSIPANIVKANSDYSFKSTLMLPVQILNQTELTAYVYTSVQFLNYVQSINQTSAISVPKLKNIIAIPQMTINVDANWSQNDIYVVKVKSLIKNDNECDLTTDDFQLKLYNNSSNLLVNSGTMSSEIINGIPGSDTKAVIFQFNYLKEDFKRGFEALITGDTIIGLEGVNEKIPISAKIVYELEP
jgi:hypothetical protein